MLQHRLAVEVCNQERNIITLRSSFRQLSPDVRPWELTSTGFLLRITKFSARIVMNRVNFLHKMRSISSACLIAMDMRIELIEGSTRTRSDSLREMMSGLRRTSTDVLWGRSARGRERARKAYPASISGTLCRSTTSDEKFSSVRAAVKVLLTAFR